MPVAVAPQKSEGVSIPVMPPSLWVASTKPEFALQRAKALGLGEAEGGLWRSVIAGQRPACIAGRGTYKRVVLRRTMSASSFQVLPESLGLTFTGSSTRRLPSFPVAGAV
jgi:hypothetical protein